MGPLAEPRAETWFTCAIRSTIELTTCVAVSIVAGEMIRGNDWQYEFERPSVRRLDLVTVAGHGMRLLKAAYELAPTAAWVCHEGEQETPD